MIYALGRLGLFCIYRVIYRVYACNLQVFVVFSSESLFFFSVSRDE